DVRPAPLRTFSCVAPVLYRGFDETSLSVMMGNDFRLCFTTARKLLSQNLGYASMKLLTFAAQQCAVGGIADKRMFKREVSARWHSPTKDELGRDELIECFVERVFGPVGNRRQKIIREASA